MRRMRQDVAVHRFAHRKTACLLTLSPLACHEAACGEPVKRRFNAWSGRRGSNPRHQAWKACALPAELLPRTLPRYCHAACGHDAWWGKDSNLRRLAPSDLQSDPVGHLGTPPLSPIVLAQRIGRADGENRTRNLLITNQLLCQLSYVSNKQRFFTASQVE